MQDPEPELINLDPVQNCLDPQHRLNDNWSFDDQQP